MKNFTIFILSLLCISVFAQTEVKISFNKYISNRGYHLQLKKVFNDSRCPKNVSCIWEGEVSAIIAVYCDQKFVEEQTLTLNSKNRNENNLWFSKYYCNKIKSIEIFPYPKEGLIVKEKKKFLKIVFID
ncbi:MAG: hypothetical protein H7239_02550 [Flavobacterium sp.]|nr:hypothetical protein [Flavobacterium sp.]